MTVTHLFEAHASVEDLDRSVAFYRAVIGLELAHVTDDRRAAFLWIGSPGQAMLGLWAAGSAPQKTAVHIAFASSLDDVVRAPDTLRAMGVTALDFDARPTDEPVVLAWMPAASVYFRDPDGHLLEYVAMLPDRPRPDRGVVSWHTWQLEESRSPSDDVVTVLACGSSVTVADNAPPKDLEFLEAQINEHNFAATGIRDARALVILLRDEHGQVYAGLSGHTWGGVGEVRFLWVDESIRRRGLGGRLLRAAEEEARARGCTKIVLSTHSFQAPDFYFKQGYVIAGQYSDYPRGHCSIFLEKPLR